MADAKIRGAIGYKGVVELQFKNGSHKHSLVVNNEGTEELGTLISIVLSGDQRNIASISQRTASHIGFQMKINEREWRDLVSVPATITSGVWGPSVNSIMDSKFVNNPDVIGKAQFSAVMSTGSVIRGYNISSKYDMRLVLRNSLGSALAYINEAANKEDRSLPLLYTALVNGQDALIVWSMFILNYKE